MSANPRSPESGDVPEEGTAVMLRGHEYVYTNLGYGESWYSRSERRGFVSPTSELAIALTAIASLTAELSTARERADRAEQPHPLVEWNPSHGTVLWWAFHDGMPYEPPYVGTPLDSDWPGYHSHWTRIHAPTLSTPTPTPDHA